MCLLFFLHFSRRAVCCAHSAFIFNPPSGRPLRTDKKCPSFQGTRSCGPVLHERARGHSRCPARGGAARAARLRRLAPVPLSAGRTPGAGGVRLRQADRYEPAAPGWANAAPAPGVRAAPPCRGRGLLLCTFASPMVRNGVTLSFEFAFPLLRRRRGSSRRRTSGRLDGASPRSAHVPRPPPSAMPPSLRDASEPLTQSAMSTRICSLDLSSVSGVPFWGPRGFPPQDAPHPTHRLTFRHSYVTTISVGRFPRGPFGLIRGGRV